jgi:hypothetical protein
VVSQRGAKSKNYFRVIIEIILEEAEIIPSEPGQVMLPRDKASFLNMSH